jgi:hypothetical protein
MTRHGPSSRGPWSVGEQAAQGAPPIAVCVMEANRNYNPELKESRRRRHANSSQRAVHVKPRNYSNQG